MQYLHLATWWLFSHKKKDTGLILSHQSAFIDLSWKRLDWQGFFYATEQRLAYTVTRYAGFIRISSSFQLILNVSVLVAFNLSCIWQAANSALYKPQLVDFNNAALTDPHLSLFAATPRPRLLESGSFTCSGKSPNLPQVPRGLGTWDNPYLPVWGCVSHSASVMP